MTQKLTQREVAPTLQRLAQQQKQCCAICQHPFTARDYAVLDHDHVTGYIRGAVHNSCNGAEGRVSTKARLSHTGVLSKDYLIGLGKYLEHHKVIHMPLIYPTHKNDDEKRIARNTKARKRRARLNRKAPSGRTTPKDN